MKQLDLREVVKYSAEFMKFQLKNILLTVDAPRQPMIIRGDATFLQQVFINLLLNAQSAMAASGRRQIEIRLCTAPAQDTHCVILSDTGKGIPTENLNKIFEPFFTSKKTGGVGLGLFIVDKIVELHNGIVFAESTLNKGTRMVLEFPASIREK